MILKANNTIKGTVKTKTETIRNKHILTWSEHISQLTTKGNNTLKFINRNIKTYNRRINSFGAKF